MRKNNNDICQHRSCQAFADFLGGGFGIAAFVDGLQKAKEMTDYKWMSAEEAQKAIAIFRVYPAKAQHATEVLLLDEYARSMTAICHVAADRLACANRIKETCSLRLYPGRIVLEVALRFSRGKAFCAGASHL